MRTLTRILGATFTAIAISTVVVPAAGAATTSSSAKPVGPNTKDGTKCKVTGGPSKGQTGTVTTDKEHGGKFCEGSWGATQCTGSNGASSGKCTASRPVSGR